MIRENSDVRNLLGISEQSLKKIRSLLVNKFNILTRGQKIDDFEFEIIKFAVDYVNDNPGASYATGIEKALQTSNSNLVDDLLSPEDLEGEMNFEAMRARYNELWDSYILMTESLIELAKEYKQNDLSNLLRVTIDLTANTLGKALRE